MSIASIAGIVGLANPAVGGTIAGVRTGWAIFKRVWWAIPMAALGVMLFLAKADARHWHKQSDNFEQLYHGEQAARKRDQDEVRSKTQLAKAQDAAHAARVDRDQVVVSQETLSAYQKDLAALRARAAAGVQRRASQANPGGGGAASVPGVPARTGGADGAAGEDGLSRSDQLIASEIALRLEHLQEWVKGQEAVDRTETGDQVGVPVGVPPPPDGSKNR